MKVLITGAGLLLMAGVAPFLILPENEPHDSPASQQNGLENASSITQADGTNSLQRDLVVPPASSDEPLSGPERSEWWRSDSCVTELQGKWNEVHAWNVGERLRAFEERRIGTEMLQEALVRSGVLLEESRISFEDFDGLSESEKEAVASCLQRSANHRMKLGDNPFAEMTAADADELRSKILENGLQFPPDYIVRSIAGDYESIDAGIRIAIAQTRVNHLKQLAPLLAELDHRKTTGLHLALREGINDTYKPSVHLSLLDPSYDALLFQIQDLHLRYRDEVRKLLQR